MIEPMAKRPTYPQQDLADRLREAMEASRVTQADLARACRVTDQAVHDWLKTGRIAKQHLGTVCYMTKKPLEYFLIGLKTWRRVAAIALLLTVPQALLLADKLSLLRCVLCQIRAAFKIALRHYFTPRSNFG